MQAEVKGQKVTWLTPHPLQQVLTEDIDFNIVLNFLEFYEVIYFTLNFNLFLINACTVKDVLIVEYIYFSYSSNEPIT